MDLQDKSHNCLVVVVMEHRLFRQRLSIGDALHAKTDCSKNASRNRRKQVRIIDIAVDAGLRKPIELE